MPTIDDAVRLIREIDDCIDAINSEAEGKVKDLKAKRRRLEAWINQKSLKDKVNSYNTDHGLAFFTNTPHCSVADWDKAWEWITANKKWEFLNHAVSKKAVSELVAATGQVPPGLNYGTKRTLCIRKPGAKV